MGRRHLILALKLACSAVFFILLFRWVGGAAFREQLSAMRPGWVAASLAMSVVMISVSCLKWRVLLPREGARPGFVRLFRYYLVGYTFTCLLPSNIGGDVVRSVYAGRAVGSQAVAAVSVFLERFTGLIVLLVLVLAAPLLQPGLYGHPAIWIPAAAAAGGLLFLAGLTRVRQPLRAVRGRLPEGRAAEGLDRLRGRLQGVSHKVKQGVHALRRDPAVGVPTAVLTVLFYGLTWVNVWISFRAVGAEPGWTPVIAVLPSAMLIAMLPVAPLAGLGLAEGAYVGYYALVGIDPAAGLAMGLLLRAKLLIIGAAGLLQLVFMKEPRPDHDRLVPHAHPPHS